MHLAEERNERGLDAELRNRVTSDDTAKRLTTIPGVGKKTAERMVLELRDKLEGAEVAVSGAKAASTGGPSAGFQKLRTMQ